jgi:hypothetical protein
MYTTGGTVGNFEQKLPPQPQKVGGYCESCTMKKLNFSIEPRRKFSLWLAFNFFEKQKYVGSPTKVWLLAVAFGPQKPKANRCHPKPQPKAALEPIQITHHL